MITEKTFLEDLDRVARNSLQKRQPEKILFKYYKDLWDSLKKTACTSAGFTGVSEYLFFRAIVFKLETETGEKFEAKPVTTDTRKLASKSMTITRDVNLQHINSKLPQMRTDIAVFKNFGDIRKLVAAMELKLYISSPGVLANMFKRLESLTDQTDSLVFSILWSTQYREEINRFYEKLPGRYYVIANETGAYSDNEQIDLWEAVDIILKKLRET